MSSTFKHASHVTVEYLNQRKLRIHLDIRRLNCGHVLGVSVYHLIAPLDPGSFCLALLRGKCYLVFFCLFSQGDASMSTVLLIYDKAELGARSY